jgi:hypothetical protein
LYRCRRLAMLVAASVLVAVADGRYNTYHCSTT